MLKFEDIFVVGVDEVGRGPLAGPVFACAFFDNGLLRKNTTLLPLIRDSKKMTKKKREYVAQKLMELETFTVSSVGEKDIDEVNILQASLQAMGDALDQLNIQPTAIKVDGNHLPLSKHICTHEAIIGGDSKIVQIAAASIIAKYMRDQYCLTLHHILPSFHFDKNQAYGTKDHIKALDYFGVTLFHRKTFKPVRKKYYAHTEQ